MRNEQLIRQWSILNLLEGSSGQTQARLARELGCSVRTIQRDLEGLCQAGFPILHEVRGHEFFWYIRRNFHVPGIPFTLTELAALALGRNLYGLLPLEALRSAFDSALSKIEKVVPALKDLAMFPSYGFGLKDYTSHWNQIQVLTDAIRSGKCVGLSYFSYGKKELTSRTLDPYDLWHTQETIYLIGFCHLRRDVRLFAVERIQDVKLLDEIFERKAGYSLDSFRGTRFRVLAEDETMTIRVRFLPEISDFVRDRQWHPTQRFKTCVDGSIILTMETAGSTEILNWVLGYGGKAEILEPLALREKAAASIRKMLKLYEPASLHALKRPSAKQLPRKKSLQRQKTAT